MSARDELTDLIRENRTVWATNTEHREMEVKQADAILAAGYSKPRTITTLDELDALPDGAIVMDLYGSPHIIRRRNQHLTPEDFHYILDPDESATVLYSPEPAA